MINDAGKHEVKNGIAAMAERGVIRMQPPVSGKGLGKDSNVLRKS